MCRGVESCWAKNNCREAELRGCTRGQRVSGKWTSSCADLLAPSMAAVHHDCAVTVMGITMLRCVGVWDIAVQEKIEGRQSSGGAHGVKG